MKRKYGWRPGLPSHKHVYFTLLNPSAPAKVDLTPQFPPVYDQGELGSCTANASAGACQFLAMKEKSKDEVTPSRLFIYYNERKAEGTVDQDSGATLTGAIQALNDYGYCDETLWPYNVSNFTIAPTASVYDSAKKERVYQHFKVDNTNLVAIKSALSLGYPIILGFSVYESFETDEVAKTGMVPYPSVFEEMLGGHAVCLVGYDDSTKKFKVRNSWGSPWGMAGYFEVDYRYFMNPNLSSDWWAIKSVAKV